MAWTKNESKGSEVSPQEPIGGKERVNPKVAECFKLKNVHYTPRLHHPSPLEAPVCVIVRSGTKDSTPPLVPGQAGVDRAWHRFCEVVLPPEVGQMILHIAEASLHYVARTIREGTRQGWEGIGPHTEIYLGLARRDCAASTGWRPWTWCA